MVVKMEIISIWLEVLASLGGRCHTHATHTHTNAHKCTHTLGYTIVVAATKWQAWQSGFVA